MEENFPSGFLYILLGVFVAAVVVAIVSQVWKQHRLNRLQNSHKDYIYRKRKVTR